jgi:hypothetical protein
MIWKDTQVRSEQRFNELKAEYQSLVSDQKNREPRRQPNKEIKYYYDNAISLRVKGNMIGALMYMNTTLNEYYRQLGIKREAS